ncbi:MAG: AAA family ATPase [Pseudomonadota bacterium]
MTDPIPNAELFEPDLSQIVPEDFSEDQRAAADALVRALKSAGVDLVEMTSDADASDGKSRVLAILGKAGSGKTHLLAWLVGRMVEAGAQQVVQEWEGRKAKKKSQITFAVVAPTNKAASVLRSRGVSATTIHRIIYSPVYDPEYEKIAQWLAEPKKAPRPDAEAGVSDDQLDRALKYYEQTNSIPAALATVGIRGSEFITGWQRREDALSVGLVDEASMLDKKQLDDLKEIFDLVCLFGDPAQLAPVGQDGEMVFDGLPAPARLELSRVHRQAADNPIIDLAYALQDDISFEAFEDKVRAAAEQDERVVVAPRLDSDAMSRSPALVWRNATRIRLIHAFRGAYGLSEDELAPGEPLICDGLEMPMKKRNRRIDFEQMGLVKGAQAFYRGPGKQPSVARLYIAGAEQPKLQAAAIIQIERPGEEEPFIPSAAKMGAVFVHGAACTVHKAQGSQWNTVQVFAPDMYAAARSGRIEAGAPLWRRLAYVAITRAQERLIWATRYAISRPKQPLTADDLETGPLL